MSNEIIFGLYNDEEDLKNAIIKANHDHLDIYNVYTPFPIHGIDPLLGIEESRLHIAGFVYGLIGTLVSFLGMTWMFTSDWPLIFGGKPHWSVPAFIPIVFELTVLFAAVGMVITFYTICGLTPGLEAPTLDDRITDDKFCLAFKNIDGISANQFETFLKETGAEFVSSKKM